MNKSYHQCEVKVSAATITESSEEHGCPRIVTGLKVKACFAGTQHSLYTVSLLLVPYFLTKVERCDLYGPEGQRQVAENFVITNPY